MPIDRRSVTRELRLLLQGMDGLAGEGLAAALQRAAEAATTVLRYGNTARRFLQAIPEHRRVIALASGGRAGGGHETK